MDRKIPYHTRISNKVTCTAEMKVVLVLYQTTWTASSRFGLSHCPKAKKSKYLLVSVMSDRQGAAALTVLQTLQSILQSVYVRPSAMVMSFTGHNELLHRPPDTQSKLHFQGHQSRNSMWPGSFCCCIIITRS